MPLTPSRFALALSLFVLAGVREVSAEQKIGKLLPDSISPDHRFGARLEEVKDPNGSSSFEVQLLEVKSGAVVCRLGDAGRPWLESVRLVWAPDSRRVAFVHRSRRGDWTDLFVRQGITFTDVTIPTLPDAPDLGGRANAKCIEASYTALRWLRPNLLLLQHKAEDEDGLAAISHYALLFDSEDNVKATRVKDPKH